jgi:membrane protease YdiL (CAAX protease family)
MDKNLKIPSPWSQLAVFFLLIGGGIMLLPLIAGLIPGFPMNGIPKDPGMQKLGQVVSSLCLFGLPALFFAIITFRDHPLSNFGFRPATKNIYYLLGFLLLLFAFPLEGWLGMLNQRLPLTPWMISTEKKLDQQIVDLITIRHSYDLAVNLVVIAVLPGVFEEMFFRGALQRILINIFRSPWAGIIVTGFLFSAIHVQFAGFLPRMFLGILLGAAYWYSGSLWTTIIAHIFFNGIQVLAAAWYPKIVTNDPSVPVYSALISLVIVVGLLTYMRRQSTVTYARIYQPTPE